MDDAAETASAAALEAARAGLEPSRAAYLAWAAGQAAAACARGPQCVENGFAVNGFRTGKTTVPWQAWLLPLGYPTSAILPLAPVLKEGIVHRHGISISSLSGVSGAGRSAATRVLFCRGQ